MIMFNVSIVQISTYYQMHFTILREINIAQITILQNLLLLFNKSNQVNCWFLMRGENRGTQAKTSQSRVENQQTQSTYDAKCGN